jgi:hypothetical protein
VVQGLIRQGLGVLNKPSASRLSEVSLSKLTYSM